ncbi:MAG: hypothetical protein BGO72_19835 [Burkholderiales bacterium 70-64]|nr:MAG: hypothetical protein BGO72_19835 [Burkholderiales bacterium 70-64]
MSWFRQGGAARLGAALIVSIGLAAWLWPAAAVQAREASKKPKATATHKAAAKTHAGARKTASATPKRVKWSSATARGKRGSGAASAHRVVRVAEPVRPSIGHAIGLHAAGDPLALQSAVALVLDQGSGEVLFEKNAQAVLPIASISKLMTAVVVLDAQLPMTEMLEIGDADVDTERNTRSRLRTGTRLSRGELLQLALMSSENRAAHTLGRHYPGGMASFVEQMNRKARELGMSSSHFVEPTGLSSSNVSNARDLALLVRAASTYPLIREYSTASALTVDTGYNTVSYRNTNRLVDRPDWDIGVQKTGYISEAGNCVVMQTRIDGRSMVVVLLDAAARVARVGDALRIRSWLESASRAEPRRPMPGEHKAFLQPGPREHAPADA